MVKNYKRNGPDGKAIAKVCDYGNGCFNGCKPNFFGGAISSRTQLTYMEPWRGPEQFEMREEAEDSLDSPVLAC
jgi:hypothetical protein